MNLILPTGAVDHQNAVTGVFGTLSAADLVTAGKTLADDLARGRALTTDHLRDAMVSATGASDATGRWCWKDAYEALEIAQVLFLRRYLPAMRAKASDRIALAEMLGKVCQKLPTHTKRSEESEALQQFSTPLLLAHMVAEAAMITPADMVLEPSAGTGLLAIFAETAGAALAVNEWGNQRADVLAALFPHAALSRHNAEHLHDYLDDRVVPSVVLMNPPFSINPRVNGMMAGMDGRHVRAALQRLAPGGRLVAITSQGWDPAAADFLDGPNALGTVRLSLKMSGPFFRQHGTTVPTRLTVIDKVVSPRHPLAFRPEEALTISAVAQFIQDHVPPRLPCAPTRLTPLATPVSSADTPARPIELKVGPVAPVAPTLTYEAITNPVPTGTLKGLYQAYAPERIQIPGAAAHPTTLVQSAAMASVLPPLPRYQPRLPAGLVSHGKLSAAQLESVIYAGEAHTSFLAGHWVVNETCDGLTAAAADDPDAVQFRRGWFLGDGTGAGKGRQVAGIILDNWLQGRRKAVWISKSDKLLEDAQRDWTALEQERLLIVPQDRYRQGAPIKLREGILFTTYATLRSGEREGKASRLQQLLDWLGHDFDGVIIFDEAHAMANAAAAAGERGERGPSQQGLAGLRLQYALPNARVVYVSATGATTVENLAYAQRLGLWGSDDLPFNTRADFVAAMLQGGIASSEVLARDLKTMGLYASRSLSYEGVEVEILEHELTPAQIAIYDAYAAAYQIIHHNLEDALKACNIVGEGGTLNRAAKSAARSAFEGAKVRFFNHLITAMKMPTLIRAIEADLAAGHAAVVQLVSTSEALMERRLAQTSPEEWGDIAFDVTPREYVLDYLAHGFPTQLFETYTDEEGNLSSMPAYVDGRPVQCKDALAKRDAMLEELAALPPVQAALDQLIHHFGTDQVAEVTGRSRRIVKKHNGRHAVLAVENRPAAANLAETHAFMDDQKRVLVFSDAGGTGRSYHADLACLNQRLRVHYLLEAGWKADAAIQGLGRTNRTNQKQPPLFRPVATDVRGEKRFLSTIARRLDSLGAITRGQRQTGGQGLFRASDNLESHYSRDALRQFYRLLHLGKVTCISLLDFQNVTGLTLVDADGTLREELPPISTFLNRLLALPIAMQNAIFDVFEGLMQAKVEAAMAAGTFDRGLETITADSLKIMSRQTVATHPSGAITEVLEVTRKDRTKPITLAAIQEAATRPNAVLLRNSRSGRVALQLPTSSLTLDDGTIEHRVRLIRPLETTAVPILAMRDTYWEPTDAATFADMWVEELATLPEFVDSTFHLVTGLLLPIWKRLPFDNPRVYAFTTDEGQRCIGRLVPPEHLHALGAPLNTPITAEAAARALVRGDTVQCLEGLTLKPVKVMYETRLEVLGFETGALGKLKALGCFSEIIAWKTRLFVPVGEQQAQVLGALLTRHPVTAIIPKR